MKTTMAGRLLAPGAGAGRIVAETLPTVDRKSIPEMTKAPAIRRSPSPVLAPPIRTMSCSTSHLNRRSARAFDELRAIDLSATSLAGTRQEGVRLRRTGLRPRREQLDPGDDIRAWLARSPEPSRPFCWAFQDAVFGAKYSFRAAVLGHRPDVMPEARQIHESLLPSRGSSNVKKYGRRAARLRRGRVSADVFYRFDFSGIKSAGLKRS